MAFKATNNTLPGAVGSGRNEDAYDSGRNHGIAPASGLGLGQSQPEGGLGGSAGVCDAPGVYNAANATKQVDVVEAGGRDRTYVAPKVEETVVIHDVEKVQPVLHQEVHQTRLHEVTHHKVAPVKDLGITEVVHHRDRDECGNVLTGDVKDLHGGAHLVKDGHAVQHGGVIDNLKDKVTGHQATSGTTGYNTGTTAVVAPAYDNTSLPPNNTPNAYNTSPNTEVGSDGHPVTGIKKLINKVIPGPGPF